MTTIVHGHAAAFDRSAEDYERGRPGYPQALLGWMCDRYGIGPSTLIVDLGAGTGKLTRLLCESPARVVAVEPLENMRRVFRRSLPGLEVLDATAQSMPFRDGSVDLVTCGQSFRWFATEEALGEIARVLAPAGACLIVANGDDSEGPLSERFRTMLGRADLETGERKPGSDWREVLEASSYLAVVSQREFENPYVLDRNGLLARLQSSSQFSRLPCGRQAELIAEFDAAVERWPIRLPQTTEVLALEKRVHPVTATERVASPADQRGLQ